MMVERGFFVTRPNKLFGQSFSLFGIATVARQQISTTAIGKGDCASRLDDERRAFDRVRLARNGDGPTGGVGNFRHLFNASTHGSTRHILLHLIRQQIVVGNIGQQVTLVIILNVAQPRKADTVGLLGVVDTVSTVDVTGLFRVVEVVVADIGVETRCLGKAAHGCLEFTGIRHVEIVHKRPLGTTNVGILRQGIVLRPSHLVARQKTGSESSDPTRLDAKIRSIIESTISVHVVLVLLIEVIVDLQE
mmetsp:Transcript_16663/g.28255  ORF Transcript_16663/g.28255 Transcript_16663/m.28255 type:complete len:248 (+) Transcript_16663:51-794(+)